MFAYNLQYKYTIYPGVNADSNQMYGTTRALTWQTASASGWHHLQLPLLHYPGACSPQNLQGTEQLASSGLQAACSLGAAGRSWEAVA